MIILKKLWKILPAYLLCNIFVLGGLFINWNYALSGGYGGIILSTCIIWLGFACLVYILADISTILPFSGGSYAYVRCMIGFYPGYICGCYELIKNMVYGSLMMYALADAVSYTFNAPSYLSIILCLIFHLTIASVHIHGWKATSISSIILTSMTIIFLLIFFFGSLPHLHREDGDNHEYQEGTSKFMQVFPLSASFFIGIESVSLLANHFPEPKTSVRIGYYGCLVTITILTIFVLISCTSSYEEIISTTKYPLNFTFANIFQMQIRKATVLTIPALILTSSSCVYAYDKITKSMVESSILPAYFASSLSTYGSRQDVIIRIGISQSICMLLFYAPEIQRYLYNLCLLSAFLSYLIILASYVSMNWKKSKLQMKNPSVLSYAIASVATLVFSLAILSIIGLQKDHGIVASVMIGLTALLSCYYHVFVRKQQKYNDEEIKIAFNHLVSKYNDRVLNSIRHKSRKTSSKDHKPPLSIHRLSIFGDHGSLSRKTSIKKELGAVKPDINDKSNSFKKKLVMNITTPNSQFVTFKISKSFSGLFSPLRSAKIFPIISTMEPTPAGSYKDTNQVPSNQASSKDIESGRTSKEASNHLSQRGSSRRIFDQVAGSMKMSKIAPPRWTPTSTATATNMNKFNLHSPLIHEYEKVGIVVEFAAMDMDDSSGSSLV
jgi:ethanolamine permease